jgi:hypothetical protein
MMRNLRRIPIGPEVTRDNVALAAYLLNLDINNFVEPGESRPLEIIYNVRGEETYLHYLDDLYLGFPYIAVSGEHPDELAARVAKHIELISTDRLASQLAALPADEAEVQRLLGWAALLAPPRFDVQFEEYLHAGFTHPSPAVRRYAVVAVGYIGWAELASPLRTLAENDSDPDVRRDARAMWNALLESQENA